MLKSIHITLIIFLHIQMLSSSSIYYKVKNLECRENPKYLQNVKCSLKAISWEKTVFSLESDIIGVLDNVSVNIALWSKNSLNIYRPFLVNITQNLCDALNKQKNLLYGKFLVNQLKRFSNINHTCPYTGHLLIRNAYMDQTIWPVVLPVGLYKISLRFFEGFHYAEVGTAVIHFELKEKQK